MNAHFDALVIGGGPAGATAGLLLARSGWRVALVEKARFPRRKVCGEFLSRSNWSLLENLGLKGAFTTLAGPEVRRLGLFAGDRMLEASMPATDLAGGSWGRALSRENLDSLLLDRAMAAGVTVWQPWTAVELRSEGSEHSCRIISGEEPGTHRIYSRVVIAAHGSWDRGHLPTHARRSGGGPSDLLAFKAHFQESQLPEDLMPLLAFDGGYGGMVHSDNGRVTLSCCIRRDRLIKCRVYRLDQSAAEAVFSHINTSCVGARDALKHATLDGPWLSVGPIQPGIRDMDAAPAGVFLIGNAAGEAHPVIAEGISMALQSAWLLWKQLTECTDVLSSKALLATARRKFASEWHRKFAPRIWASRMVANWAMRPLSVAMAMPVLKWCPSLLTCGARISGK